MAVTVSSSTSISVAGAPGGTSARSGATSSRFRRVISSSAIASPGRSTCGRRSPSADVGWTSRT